MTENVERLQHELADARACYEAAKLRHAEAERAFKVAEAEVQRLKGLRVRLDEIAVAEGARDRTEVDFIAARADRDELRDTVRGRGRRFDDAKLRAADDAADRARREARARDRAASAQE